MKKRSCERFSITGTVLSYKSVPRFFGKGVYSDACYPVLNMSCGGALFLCDQRFDAGTRIIVKLDVPQVDRELELQATVRWIAKNPEQSYRYRTGIGFSAYGDGKKQNPRYLLGLLQDLEKQTESEKALV